MRARRRLAVACVVAGMAAATPATAQLDPEDGPLADSPLYEKQNALGNIVLLHTDTDGPSFTSQMLQTSFDFVPPDDDGLNAGLLRQDDAVLEDQVPGRLLGLEDEVAIVAVDFDEDGFEEWAGAWSRRNEDVRFAIPQDLSRQGPDDPFTGLPTLGWSEAATLDLQDLGLPEQHPDIDFERPRRLRLAVGELDGDEGQEVVLGYWDANGDVQIAVIDTDGGLVPRLAASAATHALPPFVARATGASLPEFETATRSTVFDLATLDSDGDGIDEIALVASELEGSNDWRLRGRIYVYDPVGALIEVTSAVLETQDAAREHVEYIEAEGADVVATNPAEELVVALQIDRSTILADQDAEHRLMLLRVDLDNELLNFVIGSKTVHPDEDESETLSLGVADLDGDGEAEIVLPRGISFGPPSFIDVFRAVDTGSVFTGEFQLVGSEPRRADRGNAGPLHDLLVVRDLDPDPGADFSTPEIVTATLLSDGFPQPILIQVFAVEPDVGDTFALELVAESADVQVGNAPNVLAIDAGLFNGPDVRLGQPQRFSKTEITTPLVILSAPPIHFDRFGAELLDVNDCFPVGVATCEFRSSYEKLLQTSTTVTTEFHTDWSLSAEISGETSLLGATVEGSLRSTYGEGFSRVESESRTETVSLGQTADVDDFLYAATVTYDVWEYPVFEGTSMTPSGHVAVVRPRFEEPQGITTSWFNSKSFLAGSFQPDHEVGNILSYREIAAPDEANGFVEEVRWSTGDLRTLTGQGGGGFWSLGSNEVTAVSTAFETRLGLEVSVATEGGFDFDVAGFGPGSAKIRTQIEGDYSTSDISTTEVFFEQTVGINFEFGSLDPGVGQTNYGVIPYVYWTTTGALVLDYAVRPELAPPGFPGTFWQERYGGAPDPAFILPFRLDTEKGFELGSEAAVKRQQTREIRITPDDPEPGDTVTVSARVHNFSLLPSPAVELYFYLGDPADGGQRIFPDSPGPVVTTTIPPRESEVVSFEWTLPLGLDPDSARVYAVLDPQDAIADEIHEDNNVGWNALAIPVPEPGLLLLQVSGLAALAALRRRRS